jgi:indole-3-glycerol phosphate synthase
MMLDEIISNKKTEVEHLKKYTPLKFFQDKIKVFKRPRDFKYAIAGHGGPSAIRIIAEVKKASPSKGILREGFVPYEIAKLYQMHGAAAVSVVTDEKFFQGRPDYLPPIKNYLRLPVLRKDFIIDEIQVYETRALDADAMLLIVAILEKGQLKTLLDLSTSLGMLTVVEVHNAIELDIALTAGAEVIGINNRNLTTFETDIKTSLELLPNVPKDKIVIAESGINTAEDIATLKQAGASAFLIGEALMRAPDIGKKLKELRGIA